MRSGSSAGAAHFGHDRWVEDVEDWRLVGFDAMLLGSGEREEALQADWLDAVMDDAVRIGASPGSFIARCFSTVRTRAIPDIGRSSRSRARVYSSCCAAIPSGWSPAATCTRRMIS